MMADQSFVAPPPPGYIIDPSDPTRAIPAPLGGQQPRLIAVPFPKTATPQTPEERTKTIVDTAGTQASTKKTELEAANIVKPHVLSAAEVAAQPTLDPTKAWAVDQTGNYKPVGDVPQTFKVGDSDAISHGFQMLDNIAQARQTARLPHAAGTWATTLANLPVVGGAIGQNRANLMTSLGAVAGDLRQLGIQHLYEMSGKKGVGTIARSNAEQTALQNSMAALGYDPSSLHPTGAQPDAPTLGKGLDQAQSLYERHLARLFNIDPDNPASISIVQAAEANPANRQALIDAFKQNGGSLGQARLRIVTKADGKAIPPIIVPHDASDEDVRNAVRAGGYNVAPNTMVISAPMSGGAPQTGQPTGGKSNATPPGQESDGSTGGSFYHGAANALTAGLVDPFEAGAATVENNLGTLLGLNKSAASEGQIFDRSLANVKARNQADYAAHPIAGWAGTAAGIAPMIAAAIPRAAVGGAEAAPGAISRALKWLGGDGSLGKAALRQSVVTAPVGAVEGAANAGEGNRTSGAVEGGATSAAVGAALTPLLGVGGKVLGWIGSRTLPEAGTWNVFSHLAPEADPQAMAAAAAKARAAGTEPAALDTLNNASLDQVRNTVGKRPGSTAATILNDEAAARAGQAPTRIAAQARAAVGEPPVDVHTKTGQAAAPKELRQVLADKRDAQFSATIDPVRSAPVEVPEDVANLLDGPDMRPIVKGALAFTSDAEERAQIMSLSKALSSEPKDVKVGGVPLSQLSPKLRQAAEMALTETRGDPLLKGGLNGEQPLPKISLGAADALRQSLAKAEGANTPAITAARRGLTNFLEETVPEYHDAMGTYRQQSRIASPDAQRRNRPEAISLGENILTADPEQMRMHTRELGPMDTPVKFGTAEDAIAITPRQAAAEGAVRAVEQKADSANGARSLGREMTLPNGQQQARNRVLLTPEQSAKLESGVGAEANRIAAADRAAPSSAPPPEDEHAAVGAAAATLYHSPGLQGMKAMGLLQKAKISPAQADRIARKLVDPKERDAIIGQIERAGYTRARAKALYGMLAIQLGAAAGRGATAQSPGAQQ
jgi:hypothetical protein